MEITMCIQTRTHVRTHTRTYTNTHTKTHTHANTHTCTHTRNYTHTQTHAHTRTNAHTQTPARQNTHTHNLHSEPNAHVAGGDRVDRILQELPRLRLQHRAAQMRKRHRGATASCARSLVDQHPEHFADNDSRRHLRRPAHPD